jgi:hypothetical protein
MLKGIFLVFFAEFLFYLKNPKKYIKKETTLIYVKIITS